MNMEKKGKNRFYVYLDTLSYFDDLTDEQMGKLYKAQLQYASGIVPEIDDPVVRGVFVAVKARMDSDNKEYLDQCQKNRENIRNRWNKNDTNDTTVYDRIRNDTDVTNDTDKIRLDNNIKEKDSKESKKKSFAPPSVEEVREYCNERGNNVDPDKFVDYYTCKGWVVGRSKMKDWKAAVRTWEQRERAAPAKVDAFDEWLKAKERGDDIIGISAR